LSASVSIMFLYKFIFKSIFICKNIYIDKYVKNEEVAIKIRKTASFLPILSTQLIQV
jgi:hypothetical protein